MEVLIISDESSEDQLGKSLKEGFTDIFQQKNYDFKQYSVKKENLNYCIGCFNCWLKTPGICVHNDSGRDINRSFMESKNVILLSPIKYGCYSTAIKRVLDRTIPNILPFFKKIKGEVHHAPRYDIYPQLIMIGYGEDITDSEEKTFISLTSANAINFQIEKEKTYICKKNEDIHQIINDCFTYLNN